MVRSVIFGLLISSGLLFLIACNSVSPLPTGVAETEKPVDTFPTASATATLPQISAVESSANVELPSPTATQKPVSNLNIDLAQLRNQSIRLWHPWSGEQAEVFNILVDEFNATNEWGIQVELDGKADLDQLWDQLASTIQDDAPDTIRENPPEIAIGSLHQILSFGAIENTGESELVTNLQPYMDDPVWGISYTDREDFYWEFFESGLVVDAYGEGDKQAGFPALRLGQVLFYNSTWARELGFDFLPQTTDELLDQACAGTNANLLDDNPENDGSGGAIISTHYASTLGWLKAFGVPVVAPIAGASNESGEEDEGSGYRLDVPETEDAFLFLRRLYDEGCAWLPESEYVEGEFAEREGLFASASLTGILPQDIEFKNAENADEWTVMPFLSPGGNMAMPVFGPSYAILASDPEKQLAAWFFIRWLTEPQNEARWVQANGSLPLRKSTLEYLSEYREANPQWAAAVNAISTSVTEPSLASWGLVRWALHDATTQLYRSYFSAEGIPEMVDFLQTTADDLHREFDP